MKTKYILVTTLLSLLFSACSTKFEDPNKPINKKIKKIKEEIVTNEYTIKINDTDVLNQRLLYSIIFPYNEIGLSRLNKSKIDNNILNDKSIYLYIIGYSYEYGEDYSNYSIVLNRIKSVKEYLISKGFPVSNIKTKVIGYNVDFCKEKSIKCLKDAIKVEFRID